MASSVTNEISLADERRCKEDKFSTPPHPWNHSRAGKGGGAQLPFYRSSENMRHPRWKHIIRRKGSYWWPRDNDHLWIKHDQPASWSEGAELQGSTLGHRVPGDPYIWDKLTFINRRIPLWFFSMHFLHSIYIQKNRQMFIRKLYKIFIIQVLVYNFIFTVILIVCDTLHKTVLSSVCWFSQRLE